MVETVNNHNLTVPDYHYQWLLRVRTAIGTLVLVDCEYSRFPLYTSKEKRIRIRNDFESRIRIRNNSYGSATLVVSPQWLQLKPYRNQTFFTDTQFIYFCTSTGSGSAKLIRYGIVAVTDTDSVYVFKSLVSVPVLLSHYYVPCTSA